MLILRLTNATPEHKGNPVLINADGIISIHGGWVNRVPKEGEDPYKEQVTFVHCPPYGTWEVEESVEDIAKLLGDRVA